MAFTIADRRVRAADARTAARLFPRMSSHKASERGSPASSLLARISASLDALRKSERAVADFVLAHPDQVLQLSIAELADHAGARQQPVARFARAQNGRAQGRG